jgi:TolB protein
LTADRALRARTPWRAAALATIALALFVAWKADARTDSAHSARSQSTLLISRTSSGGVPNGDSTNAVISNDKRFARVIAFESSASNLVSGDTNGMTDVFAVKRAGSIANTGAPWTRGNTILISRTSSGASADGPSFSPSVDGSFHTSPTCVGFLSAATNIVPGDTNGQVDAFVAKLSGGAPKRISVPGGNQSAMATTAVTVSGNCKLIAFVTGGKLYVSRGSGRPRQVAARGIAADPSFSTGLRNDLVFGARGGVYLAKDGTGRPKLVGSGGRNPAYNDIKRQTVAYEKRVGGHWQIAYHDLGKRERIISSKHGRRGNGDSRNPVIGNSGFYVTFESDASNLATDAGGGAADRNRRPDVYLYTDTRKITLVQSSARKAVPARGGGERPGMSFYANYIVFDSPGNIRKGTGPRSIFMRYLGGI